MLAHLPFAVGKCNKYQNRVCWPTYVCRPFVAFSCDIHLNDVNVAFQLWLLKRYQQIKKKYHFLNS